jgi:hypothetical protein
MRACVIGLVLFALLGRNVFAQDPVGSNHDRQPPIVQPMDVRVLTADQRSHWGVAISFSGDWRTHDLTGPLFNDPQSMDLSGRDLEVGIVRGRDTSGEWGVFLVSKRFDRSSSITVTDSQECLGPSNATSRPCFPVFERYLVDDAAALGARVHKVFSLGTIKRRFQIGLRIGGGAAKIRGSVRHQSHYPRSISTAFRDGQVIIERLEFSDSDEKRSAEEITLSKGWLPLFDVQPGLGILLANGLKLRIQGGLSFPATQPVTVSLHYFFRAGGNAGR